MQDILPRITVITVVRDAAKTLPRAIESLVSQAYPNLEYIVLDGGSADGTTEIIRAHEAHIAFWRSEPDEGPNAAYNEGIARATGDIISLLNADDWFEPGILSAVGKAFSADPSLEIVTSEARVWRHTPNGTMELVRTFTGKSLGLTPNASPIPNARFFRKNIFERFGPFKTVNHQGQRFIASDLEFLLRLSGHEIKNRILPQTGYNYLMHEGSQTFARNPARMRQMYQERSWIAEMYLASPSIGNNYGRRLRRWHRRGTTRDFFWALELGKFRLAWQAALRGLKVSGPLWLLDALRLGITRNYRL